MTEEDDEFKRIEMESGWRKRQIEQTEHSEMCSNYGGFCKKEWVELTQEEFEKLLDDAKFTRSDLLMIGACIEKIVNLAQSKLKEKNT